MSKYLEADQGRYKRVKVCSRYIRGLKFRKPATDSRFKVLKYSFGD